MKSIDVSELNPEQRAEMQALYKEYAKYYDDFIANSFNFETWVEHTKGKVISPKWRAFKLSNIKETL
jgi:regulatory protein YycI of two-component signal transduction system YycFG